MNRRRLDTLVGGLVAGILLVGGGLAWEAYQQQRAFSEMGGMMGDSMSAMHGVDPVWYIAGALLLAGFVAALYLSVRTDLTDRSRPPTSASPPDVDQPPQSGEDTQADDTRPDSPPQILDVLPEDERRILEPVVESPGLTQIELRDRAGFSKSKVSQTASDLEKRGLLYRERQGRTYRVYPSDDLT